MTSEDVSDHLAAPWMTADDTARLLAHVDGSWRPGCWPNLAAAKKSRRHTVHGVLGSELRSGRRRIPERLTSALPPSSRHRPIHFALGFALLDVLASVELLLPHQRQLHLHPAAAFRRAKVESGCSPSRAPSPPGGRSHAGGATTCVATRIMVARVGESVDANVQLM